MSMLNEESACGRGTRSGSAAGAATLIGRARSYLGLLLGVVLRVGVDDFRHQAMPDDILRREPGEMDVLDALEDFLDDTKAAPHTTGKVDLGYVTGDDHLRPEPEPGQEHLHLLG